MSRLKPNSQFLNERPDIVLTKGSPFGQAINAIFKQDAVAESFHCLFTDVVCIPNGFIEKVAESDTELFLSNAFECPLTERQSDGYIQSISRLNEYIQPLAGQFMNDVYFDSVRYEHNSLQYLASHPFVREGLLIEGARTNFLINGSVPANWGRSTNVTATAETDSYGFLYGKFVIDDSAVGGTGGCNMASVITANVIDTTQHDEQYVTASCRFRSSNDVRLRIRFAGGEDTSSLAFLCDAYIKLSDMSVTKTGGDADKLTVSVTTDSITGWNRAVVTYKSTVTLVTAQIQFAPVSAFVSGDYMELATPQVELGTNASSYIRSDSTPSTRASDMVSITTKNNLARPPFSFLLELHKDWFRAPNSAPRVWDIANAKIGQSVIAAVNRGSNQYYMSLSKSDGAYINSAAGVKLTDNATIGAVVKGDGTFHVIMNGAPGSDATCIYGGVTQDKNIRFGGQTSDGTRHLFGHIRNFRIWHKALTDSQLSEIV